MKNFPIVKLFIAIILISLIFLKPVKAQNFDSQKAFEDYQFQQSNYLQAYSDFSEAKNFYKKNPTLQLREEARKETLKMLKSRDQLLVVYLTAIRTQLVETKGLTTDEKAAIFAKLDPEVNWYQSHIGAYADGDELSALFSKSDECKNRYTKTTKAIIYDTLFNISLSQEIALRVDHQAVYTDVKSYIDEQVALGKLTPDPFNRWINDTNSVLTVLNQNEASSRKKLERLYTQTFGQDTLYHDAIKILNSSLTPLSQLNNYLMEMLVTIGSLTQ